MASLYFLLAALILVCCGSVHAGLISGFRPPAVPLINFDPYMNIWSQADNLTDVYTTLWDNTIKCFFGLIMVDGNAYRYMGPNDPVPNALQQTSVVVWPTQTIYTFEGAGIMLNVTFLTPLIPTSLDLLSRPVSYISYKVQSTDGDTHSVQLYYDNTAEIAVNTVDEEVVWARSLTNESMVTMAIGTSAQNVLGTSGDWIGIDWGYAYVSASVDPTLSTTMNDAAVARGTFAINGTLPDEDNNDMPRAASDGWPVLAIAWDLGKIAAGEIAEKHLVFSYDDIYSIQWFGTNLQSYWHQNFQDMADLIATAEADYEILSGKATAWDQQVVQDLTEVGGDEYATIGALAYRQTLAGCKLVWNPATNSPLYFLKEISSDGNLNTVDVIFPASPFFLYFNPTLIEYLLLPVFMYANNDVPSNYNEQFACHQIGEYPIATEVGQENMPIEETGNLVILATLASMVNGVDWWYPHYYPMMEMWAQYLVANLPDTGDQLCTDDFEGPSPNNSNLAAKGIVALAAYAQLLGMLGNETGADYYANTANYYAFLWSIRSFTDFPDNIPHYALEFNLADSWSMKYNLLYQQLLTYQPFNSSVVDMEMDYYENVINDFGIPLDDRANFTKLDWMNWIAATTSDGDQSQDIFTAVYNWANTSPSRVALTDWYNTETGVQRGFQARPVVGGIYSYLLMHSSSSPYYQIRQASLKKQN